MQPVALHSPDRSREVFVPILETTEAHWYQGSYITLSGCRHLKVFGGRHLKLSGGHHLKLSGGRHLRLSGGRQIILNGGNLYY